jgi:hypothetical protein
MPLCCPEALASHAVTQAKLRLRGGVELSWAAVVTWASPARGRAWVMTVFLLCGLPARLAAIPARLSSSSLPPSFAPGRRTAAFAAPGTAPCGALFDGVPA